MARQRNAIDMAFRCWADDGPPLSAGLVAVIFQAIPTSIAKEPYIFVIFQGSLDPLYPLPLWIRIWLKWLILIKVILHISEINTSNSEESW